MARQTHRKLFNEFDLQLEEKGFKAGKGQIIDASLVSAPIQRNSREENAHKLIRDHEVTSTEVRDSQVFYELLGENTSKDVWADSA